MWCVLGFYLFFAVVFLNCCTFTQTNRTICSSVFMNTPWPSWQNIKAVFVWEEILWSWERCQNKGYNMQCILEAGVAMQIKIQQMSFFPVTTKKSTWRAEHRGLVDDGWCKQPPLAWVRLIGLFEHLLCIMQSTCTGCGSHHHTRSRRSPAWRPAKLSLICSGICVWLPSIQFPADLPGSGQSQPCI